MTITLDDAYRIIDAAVAKAIEIDQPMCIAVVCSGGNLVSFVRMDGAWIGSIKIAQDKAFTARAFNIATGELGAESQPGKQFYGIQNSNDGRIMIFAGGLPIDDGESIVGAIGVSGGSGEQDLAVAEAGRAVFATD